MAALPPQQVLFVVAIIAFCLANPTHAKTDCMEADVTVGEGSESITSGKDDEKYLHVFVILGSGFVGVQINVEGSGGTGEAFFPAEEACFPLDGRWLQLMAYYRVHPADQTARVGIETGTCQRECSLPHPSHNFRKLSVVAHGSSKWNVERPAHHCNITNLSGSHELQHQDETCPAPPAAHTTPAPSACAALGGTGWVFASMLLLLLRHVFLYG